MAPSCHNGINDFAHYRFIIFISCNQAALRTLLSVRPSVCSPACQSVCLSVTPFSLCPSHCIIVEFSRDITIDKSNVCAISQGQMSKVNVTEVKTNFGPIWAFPDYKWLRNGPQALTYHKSSALCFSIHPSNCKVTRFAKLLILTRIEHVRTVTPVWIHGWIWNNWQSLTQHREGALFFSNSSI